MAKPNPGLLNLMRQAIIQHFTSVQRGIYYEELASLLDRDMAMVNPQLDFLGDEDIGKGQPPLDALVVLKDTKIPAPKHFLYRAKDFGSLSPRDYYLSTIKQLASNLNVIPNKDWMDDVDKSLGK